jgi:hypothetical protein
MQVSKQMEVQIQRISPAQDTNIAVPVHVHGLMLESKGQWQGVHMLLVTGATNVSGGPYLALGTSSNVPVPARAVAVC